MSNQKPTNADRFVNAPFHIDGNCQDANCPIPEPKSPIIDIEGFERTALRIIEDARIGARVTFTAGV